MPLDQAVVTVLLILVLGGLGGGIGWRQWRKLRRPLDLESDSEEQAQFFRRQTRRRLVSAIILVVMAAMLVGSFFIEGPLQVLVNQADAARDRGETFELAEADKPFAKFCAAYWIVFLLLLLAVIGLAFWDLVALRWFGQREFAKIRADRRAMIEREAARLRGQKNGHAGGPLDS